jgi:hypothetical protein
MNVYYTNFVRCPVNLIGNEKFILNIFVNGQRGGLGPFTVEKIASYAEMDVGEVADIINELVKKELIHSK